MFIQDTRLYLEPLLLICVLRGAELHDKVISASLTHSLLPVRIMSLVVILSVSLSFRLPPKPLGIESLTTRAATYNTRVKWINDNAQTIVNSIKSKMNVSA